jgi:hypothetical protein
MIDTDRRTSLLNYGFIHQKYYARVEIIVTDKHTSLLKNGIIHQKYY